jgi:hypothetical protein
MADYNPNNPSHNPSSKSDPDADFSNGGDGNGDVQFDYRLDSGTGFDLDGVNVTGDEFDLGDFDENFQQAIEDAIGDIFPETGDLRLDTDDFTINEGDSEEVKEKKQKFQKTMGTIAKYALALGAPAVAALAFAAGLVSKLSSTGTQKSFDDWMEGTDPDEVERVMTEYMETGNWTGEGGEDFAQDLNDFAAENPDAISSVTEGKPYSVTGEDPFTDPKSPYQDLLEAVGPSTLGGELPPAFQDYRKALIDRGVLSLNEVLPELFAGVREKGIGAVGGITSLYEGLKGQTERQIGQRVESLILGADAQALDSYNKARATEISGAVASTQGPYSLEQQRIAARSGEKIAKAGYEAQKYAGQVDIAGDLIDIVLGGEDDDPYKKLVEGLLG